MRKPPLLVSALLLASGLTFAAGEGTLKEVVVTAQGDDVAERRDSVTQKVVIGARDIENMGALTVSDVMSKLPGVEIGAPGADGSMALRSRGMVRDSVQIYIDGEKVAGNARMAQAIVGRLPSGELERVEIVRGASAEFGGNAPVSVNLVFKKARPKESLALKAAAGFRNSTPNMQFSLSRGGGDKEFAWLVPVTMNFHGMPANQRIARSDTTGTLQEDTAGGANRVKEFVFSPRLTWKAGQDSLTLVPTLFRAYGSRFTEYERADIALPASSFARDDRDKTVTAFNRLRGDGEVLRNGVKYSGRFAFSDGKRHADTLRQTSTGIATNEQNRREDQDISASGRIDWSAGAHALAASIESIAHRREESLSGSVGYESHASRDRHHTAWVQDEWGIASGVTLTAGLRGEQIRFDSDGTEQQYRRLLPSLAVRWEPAALWILRSSLGTGIKAPRLDELSNQPVVSVSTNTPIEPDRRGNPNLRAERSVNFEAVLERYLPGDTGVFGANLYVRHTRDFVERRVQQEGVRWVDRPQNEGTARHWGMELDGKLRTDKLGWKGATFRTHLTLPRSRVQDERLGIAREARETPRYQLTGGYDQTMGSYSFGASFHHFGKVRTGVGSEQNAETRPRTLIDAYTLTRIDANLNLRLALQNLLRTDTRRLVDMTGGGNSYHLDTADRGVRTVLLSLEGKW